MGSCLWDGHEDIPPLPSAEREKLQALIRRRASADTTTTQTSDNPALKKLEEYYSKRLRTIIDPKGEKKVLADHTVFYKIYRSQLGKNVIGALSGYCLDADGDKHFLVDKDNAVENRRKNLKKLEKKVQVEGQATSDAYAHWEKCASRIQDICHDTCPDSHDSQDGEKAQKYCCKESCDYESGPFKHFQHSQTRACEVIDTIEAIRQNLLVLDKIDEGWKKRTAKGFHGGKEWEEKNLATNVDIEKITNLSSREVVEKSGYSGAQKTIVDEMEECVQNFDPKKCQKYVTVLKKEDSELLDEYSLRTKIIQEKIDKMKNSEKKEDSLESYLVEEGYTKEQIADMMEETDPKKLQDRIARRFREKRKALQRSLKEKLEKTRTKQDSGEQAQSAKMKNLKDRAVNETQRLGELIFFTNMISGFLKIEDEKGNPLGTNSEALRQELKDSIFSSEDESSPPPFNFEAIKKLNDEIGATSPRTSDGEESRNLDVQTINESLLNYD